MVSIKLSVDNTVAYVRPSRLTLNDRPIMPAVLLRKLSENGHVFLLATIIIIIIAFAYCHFSKKDGQAEYTKA